MQGCVGLGMIRVGGFAGVMEPDGEQVGFHSADAVQAPRGVGQGLDEVRFGGTLGLVFGVEGMGEFEVDREIVGGQDDDLAADGMASGGEWVHVRALLRFQE